MIALYSLLFVSSFIATTTSDLLLDGGTQNGWDKDRWVVSVDGVMGGKSIGFVSYNDSATTMKFSGTININGGGFANVGRKFQPLDLRGYAGIVLTIDEDEYSGFSTAGEKPFAFHFQLKDSSSNFY